MDVLGLFQGQVSLGFWLARNSGGWRVYWSRFPFVVSWGLVALSVHPSGLLQTPCVLHSVFVHRSRLPFVFLLWQFIQRLLFSEKSM